MPIRKVAVIGSGTMGRAIACHIASAGVNVLLLDVVPNDKANRNALAESALEYIKAKRIYTDEGDLKFITIGNLEDDLQKLGAVDLVIEAVVEDAKVKCSLYDRIVPFLSKGTIIASNTSTIPLATLTVGLPSDIAENFVVTHFFNPPRHMSLLELVIHGTSNQKTISRIREFCEVKLGKTVILCNDTPGFIANRIGFFWLAVAIIETVKFNVDIEDADAIMNNRHIGVPKTGVFALLDLVGIDVFLLIIKSLVSRLPSSDPLCKVSQKLPGIIETMVTDGYTGLKGLGGFYRKYEVSGGDNKQVIDLKSGLFRSLKPSADHCFYTRSLKALFDSNNKKGRLAWSIWSQTLCYVASIIPEVSDNISDVDQAMKLGYNWKYGPFELIDKLNVCNGDKSWLLHKLEAGGQEIPPLLAIDKKMYIPGQRITINGTYAAQQLDDWSLADVKNNSKPILENVAASLWDVGDGVACFELTSKANTLSMNAFKLMQDAIGILPKHFKCLIIGNDAKNFCLGGDLSYFKSKSHITSEIEKFIEYGQETFNKLKFSPFPAVSAASGYAVGGGCEMLLHSDAIQVHIETYAGLVEVNVGIIPGWGGCCEMILRYLGSGSPLVDLFNNLMQAKVSKSAKELQMMHILRPGDGITMNRRKLLADAKAKALNLSKNYLPPKPVTNIKMPDFTGFALERFRGYDHVIAEKLVAMFSNEEIKSESDILAWEREYFMQLFANSQTLSRIINMIQFGKKLEN